MLMVKYQNGAETQFINIEQVVVARYSSEMFNPSDPGNPQSIEITLTRGDPVVLIGEEAVKAKSALETACYVTDGRLRGVDII